MIYSNYMIRRHHMNLYRMIIPGIILKLFGSMPNWLFFCQIHLSFRQIDLSFLQICFFIPPNWFFNSPNWLFSSINWFLFQQIHWLFWIPPDRAPLPRIWTPPQNRFYRYFRWFEAKRKNWLSKMFDKEIHFS